MGLGGEGGVGIYLKSKLIIMRLKDSLHILMLAHDQ